MLPRPPRCHNGVALNVSSLTLVGAAREAALFATAPFAGAIVAVAILGDPITASVIAAVGLMVAGTVGFLTDHHGHVHTHDVFVHEHRHRHDEHHQHSHAEGMSTSEPHSHVHQHTTLTHSHPHVSDSHHRHSN